MPLPVKKRLGSTPSLVRADGYDLPAGNTTSNPPIDERRIITSDLTVSHVAGTVELGYWQTDRALSLTADDVEREFGLQAYEKMVRVEPTVASLLFNTKTLTIGNGLRLGPSHDEPPQFGSTLEQKTDWDLARQFQEYQQEVVARLGIVDEDILVTMGDQLNATVRGHTLAEKELNHFPAGKFKGRYCLQSLRVKPRENYTFILDEMNRFRGVTAVIPGVSMLRWQGPIGDASYMENAIEPEKFVILTCDKQYGNPQGISMCRAIWDPYVRLQKHIKPDMVRAGHQFGGGMITIIGPENFRDINVTDPDTGEIVNILVMIKRQAVKLGSGGVAVFPNGCTVQVHYPEADPTFFKTMVGQCKEEMYQRWFGSAEAFLPAETNSEANADTAQDTVGSAIKYFQRWLETAFYRGVSVPMVSGSFGEEFAKYAPRFLLNPEGDVDFATNMTAIAAYAKSPAWDDSQAVGFDKKLGNPQRDPNWIANKEEKAQKDAADAAEKVPPPTKEQAA